VSESPTPCSWKRFGLEDFAALKILHLSWSDRHGGAARAAFRLNAALNEFGSQSAILSASGYLDATGQRQPLKGIDRLLTRGSARMDQLPLGFYRHRETALFSPACAPDRLSQRLLLDDADLLHLHWVNNGFMRIETLPKLNKPMVWTFHDMWPFTGGCHYSSGCNNFTTSCGGCPQLHSAQKKDLSYRVLQRKKAAWSKLPFEVITPSRWLANVAASSSLLQRHAIHTIPNAIDTVTFAPADKALARSEFGLPGNAIVLLFSALTADGDKRKGLHFMLPLLSLLAEQHSQKAIHLAVLGMKAPEHENIYPFSVTYLGVFNDDKAIARAYSAADLLVAPSMEDNLPNSVMEAASCGVPSVAFRTGGLPDLIEHAHSGYLAKPFDVEDLAAGVSTLIGAPDAAAQAGRSARQHVIENYSYRVVARRHADLYAKLLVG
jgi:glycosyltransferase involved in cell wall biosynthesis